jgi:hypothetical protein
MGNVIVYDEDKPKYELTGEEVVFPLVLDQDGSNVIAYFHMDAQIPAAEIKSFVGDMMSKLKASEQGDEREYALGDETECLKFISKHFKGISGTAEEASLDEMKEFLDANPELKLRIFREGYDRTLLYVDELIAKRGLSLTRKADYGVKARHFLYSPEQQRIEELVIKHNTRKETEEDRIRYKRAVRVAEKGKYQIFRYNWDTLEQIYGSLIQSIDGMLIDGNPCIEQNKDAWLPKVPFLVKMFVVNRIFNRLAVKNA